MTDSRREFLARAARIGVALGLARHGLVTPGEALAGERRGGDAHWEAGEIRHLIPAVNHDRILLKASFQSPLGRAPVLSVGGQGHPGERMDTAGEFWAFDVGGLEPATEYELEILDNSGAPMAAPWPLRTFPDPGARAERFRLLVYTCAGGHDVTRDPRTGGPFWVPVRARRRMLRRALTYEPDAVIAIGDHVYWDLRAGRPAEWFANSPEGRQLVGRFRRDIPVLGTENESKLHLAVRPQISDLYGFELRSTPSFFLQDDHDYFENDHADEQIVTFPPDDFMLRLARATQRMYYPEFLPDPNRPAGLPGSGACDRPAGVSEAFGTVRYGRLVEMLLYDCRRFLSLKGPTGAFVPRPVEEWLEARMARSEARHVVNVPSVPPGWSAGKWGEWYPDLLLESGRLGTDKPKFMWQQGWRAQHDRLLAAASRMDGIPLFLSGDLHAIGQGWIRRSGALDLSENPVVTVLTGPVSTGPPGWPSAFRGTPAQVPTSLEVEEGIKPLERNGFTIVDYSRDRVELRFFSWKVDEPEERLDDLRPFHRLELDPRP